MWISWEISWELGKSATHPLMHCLFHQSNEPFSLGTSVNFYSLMGGMPAAYPPASPQTHRVHRPLGHCDSGLPPAGEKVSWTVTGKFLGQ